MILESAIGAVVGGIARLTPEVLGFFDRKNLRKHELAMAEQQFRVADLQFKAQKSLKDLELEQAEFTTAMAALKDSINAQAQPSGIAWVDALSSLIRPVLTLFVFGLYSVVKGAALSVALSTQETATALLSLWGAEDAALLSAVVMFWFVGRVWDKQVGK